MSYSDYRHLPSQKDARVQYQGHRPKQPGSCTLKHTLRTLRGTLIRVGVKPFKGFGNTLRQHHNKMYTAPNEPYHRGIKANQKSESVGDES